MPDYRSKIDLSGMNTVLTDHLIVHKQGVYGAEALAPVAYVPGVEFTIKKFDAARRSIARANTARAAGASIAAVDYKIGEVTSKLTGHALRKRIPREEVLNALPPIDPQANATEFLGTALRTDQDERTKAAFDEVLTGSLTSSPTTKWDNESTATPRTDIDTVIGGIEDRCGLRPNTMLLDSKVMDALVRCDEYGDLIMGASSPTNPAVVQAATIAAVHRLDRVIIASSVVNTRPENEADEYTLSRVWSDDVYLAYVAPAPNIDTPSFAYTFCWAAMEGSEGWKAEDWFDDDTKCVVIDCERWYTVYATMPAAGHRLSNVLTS
jgi:hypothetical protein